MRKGSNRGCALQSRCEPGQLRQGAVKKASPCSAALGGCGEKHHLCRGVQGRPFPSPGAKGTDCSTLLMQGTGESLGGLCSAEEILSHLSGWLKCFGLGRSLRWEGWT